MSDVASYLAGSIAPILGALMIWAKARKFSGASAAIFAFTLVSAFIALVGSTAPKVLLYKDCAATAPALSSWDPASSHASGILRPPANTRGVRSRGHPEHRQVEVEVAGRTVERPGPQ